MLIAFALMPLIEIAVLIQVGSWLGLWPTLGLIILTAVIGTWMLRRQGFAVLGRARHQLERGSVPLGEVFEGFCLVIAGALLLTPGFVTDGIGALLLLPPVRAWLYQRLGGQFRHAAMPGTYPGGGPRKRGGASAGARGPVVDGEFETVDTDPGASAEADGRQSGDDQPPSRQDGKPERDGKSMPPPRGRWEGGS